MHALDHLVLEPLRPARERIHKLPGTIDFFVVIEGKSFDEAMAWLMPIANSPHKSPRRESARLQMEQLKAAKASAGAQAAVTN